MGRKEEGKEERRKGDGRDEGTDERRKKDGGEIEID